MIEPARILLVEDNKMDIALTLDAFREAESSSKIQVAHNGEEALNYLFGEGKYSDRHTFPLPSLVLLDLKMPGIGGVEVLKKVKITPQIKRIPIIVLTSSKEEKDRAESYDHGANSYLLKPISFDGFLDVVKKVTDYWISLNVEPPLSLS
ncbi:MAG: response regulator [Bacteroidales bacterium]|nr:response regulator [Bacteroidales bacterium]